MGRGDKRLIIIVEDDKELLRQLNWMLRADYEIHESSDRKSAMRLLYSITPDIVILDLHLPPFVETPEEGLCLLKIIKTLHPDSKVIVISANTSHAVRVEVRKNGADSFLTKPFTMDELMSELME